MQDTTLQAAVERQLEVRGPWRWQALGEGVGSTRWRVESSGGAWFVKGGDADILAAEADGLKALAACGAMRVPRLHSEGVLDKGDGYLIMEWLELSHGASTSGARLGEALARQHLAPAPRFGWPCANFIGATPQFNREGTDWAAFFREQRLGFQLRLAGEDGHRGALQEEGARLLEGLPRFFAGYAPSPALLHGDLWGGNWGTVQDGGPVVFDPAVYRGDREADLAMTELFGGFPESFYAAYNAHAPLDAGYRVRRDLYNLYHVLNHLNLFGGGYLGQALGLIRKLNAELG
ncbi:MAG TPA: fructosamine kinase family protein [Gammaproteobacteria bacterium]|jgi:fructosamine-3-kinase|nr:fructosamine kinase family protein [Gammaproteobacteria bacterium]